MEETVLKVLKIIQNAARTALKAGEPLADHIENAIFDESLDAVDEAIVRMDLKTLGFDVLSE